jgi:cell division protein FtsI (penicillin-binding protein 3)
MGVYEMGSTFKIFSTAAVLNLTRTNIHDTFDATKPIQVAGYTINDFHGEKRWLSVPEVFIHSSNIGTAKMADRIGTPAMMKFYSDLGLFYPAQLEIDEIGKPLVPYPWRHINTLTASYGHGIAVSPLQLVTAVSAITNGGYLPHPTLVKRPDSSELLKGRHRVISSETSRIMNNLLRLAVTDGTGGKADAAGYLVGGKTGSAEKPGNNGYNHHAILSSFVGVFPTDKPRYVVFAMIDEPKGNDRTFGYATGGWIAAPVVGRVIQNIAPYLGIEMKRDTFTQKIRHSMRIQQKGRRLASF